eukprot:2565674-Pyramimonas_sp.AAC.1
MRGLRRHSDRSGSCHDGQGRPRVTPRCSPGVFESPDGLWKAPRQTKQAANGPVGILPFLMPDVLGDPRSSSGRPKTACDAFKRAPRLLQRHPRLPKRPP